MLTLVRYESSPGGTRGLLSLSSTDLKLHTIERPWLDNTPFESCVPSGVYTLSPHVSSKFGDCFRFVGGTVASDPNVAARYACLIHVANYARQVQGCIGIGLSKGETPTGDPAVWSSKDALRQLRSAVPTADELVIAWGDEP
tara:strand:+ start:5808 stop:6233 length:426 start_codon:yes stop_codon:yes gene_type:complete